MLQALKQLKLNSLPAVPFLAFAALAVMDHELSSLTVLRLKVRIKASAGRFLLRAVREKRSVPQPLKSMSWRWLFSPVCSCGLPVCSMLCFKFLLLTNTCFTGSGTTLMTFILSQVPAVYEWNVSIPLKFIC